MNSNSRFEFLTKFKLSKWQLATFEILFEYYEFALLWLGNGTPYGGGEIMEHECEV